MSRVHKLLLILQSYAPDGLAAQKVVESYENLKRTNSNETFLEKAIVNAIHDGLHYGNWPWTNHFNEF